MCVPQRESLLWRGPVYDYMYSGSLWLWSSVFRALQPSGETHKLAFSLILTVMAKPAPGLCSQTHQEAGRSPVELTHIHSHTVTHTHTQMD